MFQNRGVVPKVNLVTYEYDWDFWTVVLDLWVPLLLYMVEGDGTDDGEAC